MPRFDYQCVCGLMFEGYAPMADSMESKDCPDCGKAADRAMPDNVEGSFEQDVSGPVPQNTGVSQIDAVADRAIGKAARQGWEVADRRVRDKRRVIADTPGATGHDLSRNPDGSYRVMTPEEKGVHDRSQKIHGKAMTELGSKKDEPAPASK